MSLQFVMGPSGSGKSHYLYQKVTEESLKYPEKNYIVLVPDQFTMQTQKDLVLASPRKGIINVDVLSFSRLAHRVFEETGENQRIILNDVGKNLVLRKIAGDYESELQVLGSNLKKAGFISEVKSVISEFTQYDVQSETLERMIEEAGTETSLSYKLRDLATIYQGFHEYLQGKYITGEEMLDILCQAVPKSKILKDSIVVLDGFTGFTPIQNKLLRELLLMCEKVVITVTTNSGGRKLALFDLSEKMMTSLVQIARECKIEIEEPVQFSEKSVYRFRDNEALGFLESHLFRHSRENYLKEQDSIRIFSAKNPKEEMEFVAQNVRKLVRSEGLRYRDIAVIVSDMNAYVNQAERAFAKFDIPVFMDHKRSILLNSFVEYLRSLLAMAEQNFTYESVFRYLRTDITGFTKDEVDLLENYCVALGIRGYKKWQEKWIRRTKGMEESDLAMLNEIRVRFISNIENVMSILKSRSKTVEDITRALHAYFVDNEIQQRVHTYELMFAEEGELALEKEYAQVYRIVMDLFDQFVELLGDEKISLTEYCELLDAGLEEAKVGIIPPSLDQIVIGDIERTRIKDVKVLFFVGMNDAYIPGKSEKCGLLSEYDREKIEAAGVTLAPGAKEKSFIQKFYLYLILTKPSERVVLTYSQTSSSGDSLRQAYLIAELQKMYPKLQVEKVQQKLSELEMTKTSGISYLVEGLREKSKGLGGEWQELYTWYKKNPEWSSKIEQIMEAAFYEKPSATLTKKTAENLYGNLLANSVSRLEKFSACAYAHFLAYGLRLKEREMYQFQAVDLGNLFHGAMERFSMKLKRGGYSWVLVPEETREQFIKESVEECIVDYGNTILYSTARNEYMIHRLERLMKRTIWALTKQLEKGDFEPAGFEIAYDSGAISLEDRHAMRVYGKIDRIDVCETDDEVYVKVVDYKTGAKAFSLNDLYHGLQMQLIVYMNAAVELERQKHPKKQITPAGFVYYAVEDPVIPKQKNEGEREAAILKQLKPDGMINRDGEVIRHLDSGLETGASTAIPVGKNKDGSLAWYSKVLSEEELELLSDFAKKKMKEIGNAIMDGDAEVNPYKMGDRTSCTYCRYKGICGFDEKLPGFEYRKLEKFDNKKALEKMREEV